MSEYTEEQLKAMLSKEDRCDTLEEAKAKLAPASGSALSDYLKAQYFDVIYHFGILVNTGNSPSESPGMPYRIPINVRSHGCTTCYGKTVEEVCGMALDWLESKDKDWRQNHVPNKE